MLSGPSCAPSEQQDLALEGRSISLQHRALVTTTTSSVLVSAAAATPQQHLGGARSFQPLQLRIDLQGEQQLQPQGQQHEGQQPTRKESRRQRLQARRREQQQRPAQEVVYQRRGTGASSAAAAPGVSVFSRPKTAARLPLPISTTSMPAHNQKFSLAGDTATAALLGSSAQEASAVVKRLLAEEHHHHVSSSTMVTSSSSSTSMRSSSTRQQQDQQGYLQDSFNFLHQRHIKNLTDVISQHQKQQKQREQQQQQQQEQIETAAELAHTVKHKKQVHIHQSSFYEQGSQNGHHNPIIEDLNGDTSTSGSNNSFKSTKTINLSNGGGGMGGGGGNLKRSSTSDSTSSSTSSVTRYRNTTSSSSDECCSDNFNNNINNIKNNKMNNHLSSGGNFRTNTELRKQSSTTSTSSSTSSSSRAGQQQAKQKLELENGDLLQDDGRIAIDVTVTPGGRQGYTSSSSKSVRTNTVVSTSVSDGRTVRTDVEKLSEEAEERSEGPVITFSHVSSEGCQESFQHRLDEDAGKLLEDGSSSDLEAAVMGMKMSSPVSRSRSASPLLEVPAPTYSREIRRPPMEKA